jgi:hypothetical protein
VPARAHRPAQVGQTAGQSSGKTFSIASTVIAASNSLQRRVLEADLMEATAMPSRPRLGQHPRRLVDPDDAATSGHDRGEVLAVPHGASRTIPSGGHVATSRSTNRRWVSTGYGDSS